VTLHGHVVLVTGAARGIGQLLAAELRHRGASVITADLLDGVDHRCDISDEAQVQALFAVAGPIDGLVNNAGLLPGRTTSAELTVAEFRRMMDVNVLGTFLCSRAAAAGMDGRGGSIVNIASETAFSGSHGFPHYVASKGAVVALTRAMANEYGPMNIRVNCVAPGFTRTPGSAALGEYDPTRTPLGRVMEPQDLVGTITYLLSDDAAFVSGQTILVNGGRVPH
jgi:NAD(P)-dependent dehydrogenase (short-subunit alcohol dehydrogenase family)